MSTTYDLSMSRLQVGGVPALQQLAGPGDKGEVVTGGAKLAQQYVVILMTEKGSIPYATGRGSNFINILRMTGISTEGDIFTAFTGAQLDLNAQLKPDPAAPADEQFSKATVNGATITSEGVTMEFTIFSKAGIGVLVRLPLAFILK